MKKWYMLKNINKLNYDNTKYDFRDIVKKCFNVENLSEVHKNNPEDSVFKEFGPMFKHGITILFIII